MRYPLILTFLLITASVASAQTRYVDFVNGSDLFDGTSITHTSGTVGPWKSSPYMQGNSTCSDNGGAHFGYVHAAGQRINFKGGVTWPAACLDIVPTAGGTSGNPDIYGVDLTWFAGATFTKPIWDAQNTIPTSSGFCGGSVFCPTPGSSVGFITVDNIEIKGMQINTAGGAANGNCNNAAINFTNLATGHFIVQNSYLHGWQFSVTPTFQSLSYQAGGICQTGSNNLTVINTEISDADGKVVTIGAKAGSVLRFGGAIKNASEIKNCKIHDTMAGSYTAGSTHDSQFYNITSDVQSYDSNIHSQVIEDDTPSGSSAGGRQVYNNLIHDNTPVGVTIYVPYNSFVYNNVMWNNGNTQILLTPPVSDSVSNVGDVVNNVVDCSNGTNCVGMDFKPTLPNSGNGLGTLILKNNQWITNGTATCFNTGSCKNISTITAIGAGGNNITMTPSSATAQGYTIANKYAPTSSSNSTVNAGLNLTSSCGGNLLVLCSATSAGNTAPVNARPATGAWDVGPYEFSSTGNPPGTPTGLTASVSGSMISLSWTLPTTSPVPTASTLYRGTVHNGPYTAIQSGISGSSTTDTPANGTYFYVVTDYIGGIVSSITGNGTTGTITCAAACSFPNGTVFTVAGNSQAGFNSTFITSTGQPTSSTITFNTTVNATGTGGGVWQPANESAKSNEVSATVPAALTLFFAPASLTFASQTVGTSSPTQTEVVMNTSSTGSTVTFSSVAFTGTNPGDFSRTTTCTTLTVNGQTCNAVVTFTPTAAGARSALLTFTDNATGSPQTIPVSGTGVTAVPVVSLSPGTIIFGPQLLTTTSVAVPVTLKNTGSGTLTISSTVALGDFAQSNGCGATLAPTASCTINVTFTPTVSGARTGSLTVTDNAAGSPHVVALSGTGITTKCSLTGATVLSGVASVCQ